MIIGLIVLFILALCGMVYFGYLAVKYGAAYRFEIQKHIITQEYYKKCLMQRTTAAKTIFECINAIEGGTRDDTTGTYKQWFSDAFVKHLRDTVVNVTKRTENG